jgi:prevent-host-death family protein
MVNMSRRHVTVVNVAEAKARFSELLRRVSSGEEVVIARDHRPIARLTAVQPPARRRPGSGRDAFGPMAPDFDAPLEDFAEYMK